MSSDGSDLRFRYAEAIRRVDAEVAASRHAVYLTDDVILDALVAVRDAGLESLRERAETAERRLARVSALHQVHHCEDGHLLSRTPVPCENDGYCSCGQPGDRCPTRAVLSSLLPEEETDVRQ